MLAKDTFNYLISKGIPSLLGFVLLIQYSNELKPEDYGLFQIVLSSSLLLNSLLFHWIKLSLLRFYESGALTKRQVLSNVVFCYSVTVVTLVVILIPMGYLVNGFFDIFENDSNILYLGGLSCSQSLFEVSLEYHRARLKSKNYALSNTLRIGVYFILAQVAFKFNLGTSNLLIFLTLSFLVIAVGSSANVIRTFSLSHLNFAAIRGFANFGIPLSLTSALNSFTVAFYHFLIAYELGMEKVAFYSINYDLIFKIVFTILMVLNLGSLPRVMRIVNKGNLQEVRDYLTKYSELLVLVAFPLISFFVFLSQSVVQLTLNEKYWSISAQLLPLMAVATVLRGFKVFYFDHAFQISSKTKLLFIPVCVSLIISVPLTWALIKTLGLFGVVVADFFSYLLGLIVSVALSQKHFTMPIPFKFTLKIAAASIVAGLVSTLISTSNILATFFFQLLSFSIMYLIGCILLRVDFKSLYNFVSNKNG